MSLTMESSVEVTKSIGAHKAYSAHLIQFWVSSFSCPFSSHLHAINSYLSLIPKGKMSLLINFHASICHQIAIMQSHRSPFQSQLSEKLKMVLVAHIFLCIQFIHQRLFSSFSCLRSPLKGHPTSYVLSNQSLQRILEVIRQTTCHISFLIIYIFSF